MKQHHAKIADIYASSQTQQPLVVLSYDEDCCTGMEKGTALKTTSANKKMQAESHALARCLLNGNFWHAKRGTVAFTPARKVFIFCNVQPRLCKDMWTGWTFYNVSDLTL